MPGSLQFYPTTDHHLQDVIVKNKELPSVVKLASFILNHRKLMNFRLNSLCDQFVFLHLKKIAYGYLELIDSKNS